MRNSYKFLMLTIILLTSTNLLNAYTNKTFLKHRPQGVNLAMESTTFFELKQIKKESLFGGNFQAVPFYSRSTDKSDLGKYFGADGKNIINFKNTNEPEIINIEYLIHYGFGDANGRGGAYSASIKLEPEQTTYGVMLTFCQELEKTIKGLFFKINMPVVQVENDMNLRILTEEGAPGNPPVGSVRQPGVLAEYFSGKYKKDAVGLDSQAALTHAKINNQDHEASGIADIDVMIGYKLFDKEKYKLCINAGVVIPTGNSPEGEWLFEPVYGNGGHWGIGGGVKFSGDLWNCDKNDQSFRINVCANYRYLLEEKEKRTLGIKLKNFENLNVNDVGGTNFVFLPVNVEGFSQYYAIGKNDDTYATPAANVLTRDLYVEPKSQLDAIAALTYNYKNFTFDLGYNFFWKDSESVSVKTWDENTYGIVASWHDFGDDLDNTEEAHWASGKTFDGGGAINKKDLDLNAARTPSYTTHKIFAGAGYIARKFSCPVMVGLGGAYEFASNNHEIENWSIWGKFGVAF